jgi:hypothetical protein
MKRKMAIIMFELVDESVEEKTKKYCRNCAVGSMKVLFQFRGLKRYGILS